MRANVTKEINNLVEDSAARLGKLGDNVSQATVKAKEDVTTWAEDSAAQLSKGLEKYTRAKQRRPWWIPRRRSRKTLAIG